MPLTHEFDPHTFKANWKHVTAASWRKYPHPASDIISVDIIRKQYDPEAGTLHVRRFLISEIRSAFPSWFPSLPTRLYFVEDSVINLRDKTYTLDTINLGITRNILQSNERCFYSVDPNNSEWTRLEQRAHVISPIYFIGSKIESLFCANTIPNVGKGRKIMNETIHAVRGYPVEPDTVTE